MRLRFHPIDKWNLRLRNALDMDLKIILSQNVKSKYALMKNLIVHVTTGKIIATARYMHLWHEYIATTNGKIMVRLKTETENLCKRGDKEMDSLWTKSSV